MTDPLQAAEQLRAIVAELDPATSAPEPTVTVQDGETLDDVAARIGADPAALFAANRGLLGSTPAVTPGQVLDRPTS